MELLLVSWKCKTFVKQDDASRSQFPDVRMPGLIGIAVGAFSSLDNSVSAIGASGRSATKVVGCCGSGKARILPSTSRCISSAIATKPRRDWLAVVRRKGRVASIAAGVMAWRKASATALLNHCTAKVQAV